jgi:4-azaleucine resistance transporter AzlC
MTTGLMMTLMIPTVTPTRRAEFWGGVRATVPLMIGSAPFALIFGALAIANGLTPAATQALSALVFAGSAQFIAVGLIASGAGLFVIVLTTAIVNLRHLLYGVSLAPYLKALPQRWLALLAFLMTDETYAVAIERFGRPGVAPYRHWYYLGSAAALYVNWQLWSWIGIRAGQRIEHPQRWGLEFAFVATFLGLMIPTVQTRPQVACVAAAGVSALLFRTLPHQLGLILAALIGVAAGMVAARFGVVGSEGGEQEP